MSNFEFENWPKPGNDPIGIQLEEDNIAQWLREHCPESYVLYRHHIAILRYHRSTKLQEFLYYKNQIVQINNKINDLEDKLEKQESLVAGYSSKLRAWEREESNIVSVSFRVPFSKRIFSTHLLLPSYKLINNIFEWLLKAGLSVVPILGLVTIVGGRLSVDDRGDYENIFLLVYVLFAATALTWMIASYISNWILSKGENESIGYKGYAVLAFIWLSEALIGIATIPKLLKFTGAELADRTGNKEYLYHPGFLDYSELFIGIGLFSFINILAALAKAKRYRSIKQERTEFSQCLAEKNYTIKRCKQLREQVLERERKIAMLEEEIKNLEREIINPNYDSENLFNRSIAEMSTLYMQGKDIASINPPQKN